MSENDRYFGHVTRFIWVLAPIPLLTEIRGNIVAQSR